RWILLADVVEQLLHGAAGGFDDGLAVGVRSHGGGNVNFDRHLIPLVNFYQGLNITIRVAETNSVSVARSERAFPLIPHPANARPQLTVSSIRHWGAMSRATHTNGIPPRKPGGMLQYSMINTARRPIVTIKRAPETVCRAVPISGWAFGSASTALESIRHLR